MGELRPWGKEGLSQKQLPKEGLSLTQLLNELEKGISHYKRALSKLLPTNTCVNV